MRPVGPPVWIQMVYFCNRFQFCPGVSPSLESVLRAPKLFTGHFLFIAPKRVPFSFDKGFSRFFFIIWLSNVKHFCGRMSIVHVYSNWSVHFHSVNLLVVRSILSPNFSLRFYLCVILCVYITFTETVLYFSVFSEAGYNLSPLHLVKLVQLTVGVAWRCNNTNI